MFNTEDSPPCPACGSLDQIAVYEKEAAYFSNLDISSKFAANACRQCGFVFQSSAYSGSYDNMLLQCYSNYNKYQLFPFPNRSAQNAKTLEILLERIPNDHCFNILEIGSNRGDMLFMIKERRPAVNVLGIEPAGVDCRVPTIRAAFANGLLSNKFDLIILQHVFEHIKNPRKLIADIRHILSDTGVIYIEVPNLDNTLGYCLDDFILEHVNYFTVETLSCVLDDFSPVELYSEDFIRAVYARAAASQRKSSFAPSIVERFHRYRTNRQEAIEKICRDSAEGKTLVFYGVSYYYKMLMRELAPVLNLQKCMFYDDNYLQAYEQEYGLRRLTEFNGSCVVIICSNNFIVQDEIYNKICGCGLNGIVRPWRAS